MSYESWHTYGIGFCTEDIATEKFFSGNDYVQRLESLLSCAPVFQEKVRSCLEERGIQKPDWDDYCEYDDEYYCGLGTLLAEVIREAENLDVIACDDCNGHVYVLYSPRYPWQMEDREKNLTEEEVKEIFRKYISILTDASVEVDEQSVENGG